MFAAFVGPAAVPDPVYVGLHARYPVAHAACASAAHVDPRTATAGYAIVDDKMGHRHPLRVLEPAHWKHEIVVSGPGYIPSDHDGILHSQDCSNPTHFAAHTVDVGNAARLGAGYVADVVEDDDDAAVDFGAVGEVGAVDAGSAVGDVVYDATANSVVYVAASCGSAGGELDRCPLRWLSYGCASIPLAANCMLLLQEVWRCGR